MSAALPDSNRFDAPTTYHPHPGHERPVGCPSCGSLDHLVIEVPAVVRHQIHAWAIDGVTVPEIEVDETILPDRDEPVTTIAKVKCTNCRWGLADADPLAKLREP